MRENSDWDATDKGISLDINSTGIHFETLDQFSGSYYSSVYKNAFLQLNDIIKHNSIWKKDSQGERYAELTPTRLDFAYERVPNILTFVGKRGSGKSSVMLSFMNALKDYYVYYTREESGSLFYEFEETRDREPQKIVFTCLNCIDGSLLEHGEDIFKIVLAQMYQKFIDLERKDSLNKSDDFDYRKRDLLKDLEGIYKTVCDIDRMENGHNAMIGESYMSNLQSLSSSQKVKRDFAELITKFTALMKYKRDRWMGAGDDHYVVITIDDIDLNIKNGFSMLEKIHRYCIVPNVIVLLSVDIEQMLSIVLQNFYEVLPKVDKMLREGQEYIYRVSLDYLDKVMPANYRVYLPKIEDVLSDKAVSIKKEQATVKEALLWKLYRKTAICFDSQGKQRHFYEPRSMRQMTSFYLLLDSMEQIELGDLFYCSWDRLSDTKQTSLMKEIAVWEDNCRIMIADLSNRIIFEKLYDNRILFNWFNSLIREEASRAKDLAASYPEVVQKNIDREYSYGELIEALYWLGNVSKEDYKSLVHCLLPYFSYVFTKQYLFERLALQNEAGKARVGLGSFQALVGKNILDKWVLDLLPKVPQYRAMEQGTDEASELGEKNIKDLVSYAAFDNVALAPTFSFLLKDPNDKELFPDDISLFRYAVGVIQSIEIWMLLFNNIRSNKNNVQKNLPNKFEILNNMRKQYEISMKPNLFVGDFNILNFVINSMYASKNLKYLEKALYDCMLKDYVSKRIEKEESWELEFAKIMKEYSLQQKYESWEGEFGRNSLPLPIYWIDLTYNILKRTRRDLLERNRSYVEYGEMYYYIQRLFSCIEGHLERQDSFYKFNREGKTAITKHCDRPQSNQAQYSYRLKERFQECPFVQYFQSSNGKMRNFKVEFIVEAMMRTRAFHSEG